MPTDELTGIPLLLIPEERALSVLYGCEPTHTEDGRPIGNLDHTWFPAKEIVHAGAGGAALRQSRVQFVLVEEQHEEKNGYFDAPSVLPATPLQRFTKTTLCAAGYVPPKGIGFNSTGYYLDTFTDWQLIRLRESGEMRVGTLSTVQKFMTDFLLDQPIEGITRNDIDEFLKLDPFASAHDAQRQNELARHLLLLSIGKIEAQLIEPYTTAYNSDLLCPDAPPEPGLFLEQNVIRSHKNLRTIANGFVDRLRSYREGRSAVFAGGLALGTA